MPTRLPSRPRARAIRTDDIEAKLQAHQIEHAKTRRDDARESHDIESVDWLALWALSLGFSAMLIAGLAYFSDGDANGAAAVLVGTAIIIAAVLSVSKAPAARGQ